MSEKNYCLAAILLEQVVAKRVILFGAESIMTQCPHANLASCYLEIKRYKEALNIL